MIYKVGTVFCFYFLFGVICREQVLRTDVPGRCSLATYAAGRVYMLQSVAIRVCVSSVDVSKSHNRSFHRSKL